MYKKEEILQLIIERLPYPQQIKDIEFSSTSETVYFTWRGTRYKVADNLHIEQVANGLLITSDICIILRALLSRN